MTDYRSRLELLAPAGDMEKLKTAIIYGADAVYFGGQTGSLRAGAGNLSVPEIREAMDFIHSHGCKGYMTLNIYAHNEDIPVLRDYIGQIKDIPIDAFLVSDPGVMGLIREQIPDAEIHLSTQANTTNYLTAAYWVSQGVRRIVAAREMSLKELAEMRAALPDDRGACTHPCRWKYHLVEEQRPGEYYPIEEDERGSYIMNSRDLCMIDCIPDLVDAGVTSFKIEGRMKSMYYVATVVAAYRSALDKFIADPVNYQYDPHDFEELCKASHREFTHGFYYNKPTDRDQNYLTSDYIRDYSFVGLVREHDPETGLTTVEQRNKFSVGDTIEIFGPHTPYYEEVIEEMYDEEGNPVQSAPHPQQVLRIRFSSVPGENFIMRKRK